MGPSEHVPSAPLVPLDTIYTHSAELTNDIEVERQNIDSAKGLIDRLVEQHFGDTRYLEDLSGQLKGRIDTLSEGKRGTRNFVRMFAQGKLAEWRSACQEQKSLRELHEYTMGLIPHTDWEEIASETHAPPLIVQLGEEEEPVPAPSSPPDSSTDPSISSSSSSSTDRLVENAEGELPEEGFAANPSSLPAGSSMVSSSNAPEALPYVASSSGLPPPPPPPPGQPAQRKAFENMPSQTYDPKKGDLETTFININEMKAALAPIRQKLEEFEQNENRLKELAAELKTIREPIPRYRENIKILESPEEYVDMTFNGPDETRTIRFYSDELFEQVNAERREHNQRPLIEKFTKTHALEYFNEEVNNREGEARDIERGMEGLRQRQEELKASRNNDIPFSEWKALFDFHQGTVERWERAARTVSKPSVIKAPNPVQETPQPQPTQESSDPNDAPTTGRSFDILKRGGDEGFYNLIK